MADYDWLDAYLCSKPGCEKDFKAEWEWWRYLVGGKMFAATLCPGPEHDSTYAERSLLTLKCDPVWSQALRSEHEGILPGFYMDKRNWISVVLDGSVPDELVRELCDHSYSLVFSKLTKKLQREISSSADRIERLLETPCWVIDVLPSQVPTDSGERFFAAEGLLLEGLRQKFADVLLKLSCYYGFEVHCGEEGSARVGVEPSELMDRVLRNDEHLSVAIPSEDALISIPTDSTCMVLHNPASSLLEQVKAIALASGLFVWQPPEATTA